MNLLNLSIKVGMKDEASDKLESLTASTIAKASAIGNAMYDAAKFVGTKTFDMLSNFTRGVVDVYGQFEQMEGGIKKLYEDAADTVIANSEKAFREAGMSQTQYLQSSTTLAASLIKSLDGDMQAAAERNAVAMKAIADNADTFGTSVEDVTAVYSSLSRGMYQTLDNLRLGYAGTKTGMQELINDANAYAEEIGEAGDMTIDSFADIVRAIDLIQQKQGIAGTTAKEALTTIEGSLRMLRNSWQDFMMTIGSGDVDRIRETMQNIHLALFGMFNEDTGEMEGGVIRNILPRVQNAVEAVVSYLPQLASSLAYGVAEFVAQALGIDTGVIDSALELGKAIVLKIGEGMTNVTGLNFSSLFNKLFETIDLSGIMEALSTFGTAISEFWQSFTGTLDTGNINVAIESVSNIIQNVWGFIEQNILPHASEIGEVIATIANVAMEVGNSILNVLEAISPYISLIIGALAGLAALEVVGTIMGIVSAIGGFISAAVTAVSMIQSFAGVIAVVGTVLSGGLLPIIVAVVGAIVGWIATHEEARQAIADFCASVGEWFVAMGETIAGLIQHIIEIFSEATARSAEQWEQLKADAAAAWNALQEAIVTILVSIVNWVMQKWAQVKEATSNAWHALVSTVTGIGSSIVSAVTNIWNTVYTSVTSAMQKVQTGVSNGWTSVVTFVKGIPSKIVSALGDLSSLLLGAGKDLMSGLMSGISAGWESITSSVSAMAQWIKDHKGPKQYDLALLVENGQWIMSGLYKGLQEGYEDVQKLVSTMADGIDMSVHTSFAGGVPSYGAAVGMASAGDVYNVYLNVEDRNDFNGMALAFVDAVQSVKRNSGRATSMNVRMV